MDPAMCRPYDFFQYWRNTQDADVKRFLLMFTFLPVGEVEKLTASGTNPNAAKERLAWEVTALIHGSAEADKALSGAKAAFGGGDRAAMPGTEIARAKFEAGYNIVDLFTDTGLASSKSEARRLVHQGGAFVSDAAGALAPVSDPAALIGADRLDEAGELVLRAGKKRYCRIIAK
jgi:tyrosyl-tRNA synthetase